MFDVSIDLEHKKEMGGKMMEMENRELAQKSQVRFKTIQEISVLK